MSQTTTIERRPPEQSPVVQEQVTEADVLRRAADLLEEFGWCQRRWGSKAQGEMCATGAIREALAEYGFSKDDLKPIVTVARLLGPPYSIISWHDTPGRTKAEVTAALRQAAERVEAR